MSYLYSKLPETGVSPHIGTGGERGFTFGRYSEGKGLRALQQIVERVKYTGLRLSGSDA
jgi:hypothetical protein